MAREKQKEKHNEYRQGWYRLNKSRILKQGYEKKKEKLKTDPEFKLKETIGHGIRRTIYDRRGVKSKRTLELLGCSVEKARRHIERQFRPGMTWDNHGTNVWHIDHIIPCSAFDLTDPEEQEKCFNYKNLQPLWSVENLKKGKKHDRQQRL